MIFLVALLACIAVACLLLGGYLLGIRRGQQARLDVGFQLDAAQAEVARLTLELANRPGADPEVMRQEIARALGPILERERVGSELARIETGGGTLGDLPRILDSIAEKGGFISLLLGDEVGLPLAASAGARDVEVWAGGASLLLSLSDRLARSGSSPLVAVVMQDETNQIIVHRIFRIGAERFILSAMSRGQRLGPDALDAAMGKIESILSRRVG
jgi:hypothetical protein